MVSADKGCSPFKKMFYTVNNQNNHYERTHNLKFSTLNCRGLTNIIKQNNLMQDLTRLKLDLCCLQETKINSDIVFIDNFNQYKFIFFLIQNQSIMV